jgi:ribosomal protein L24
MTTEDNIVELGDAVRLRSGPYAGKTGMVVSVHPQKNPSGAGTLVMVKLMNGKINSCYMSNLEKVKKSPDNGSFPPAKEGGKR